MKCDFCSNPASVHLTKAVNKQISEIHLCEDCAREKNLIPNSPQDLNVPAVLELALTQMPAPPRTASSDSICPVCGTPYAHFRSQGRLGCPHDYSAFRSMLEPVLERVQSGAIRHVGKSPRRHRKRLNRKRRVELEAELKQAVETEHYEDAAKLRDAIRALGSDDEL